MARKATIFKAELSLADLDRNLYEDFSLTVAQHPSENDLRMMVRLLAFTLFADARLEFGRGLSTDDEPDLWQKDLTGAIELWISVGQLDERWDLFVELVDDRIDLAAGELPRGLLDGALLFGQGKIHVFLLRMGPWPARGCYRAGEQVRKPAGKHHSL